MENDVQDTQEIQEETREEAENLQTRVEELEMKIKQIQEEFNGQRAKMKELFLQKEDDLRKRQEENVGLQDENTRLQNMLDEAKSQLLAVGLKTEEDLLMEKRKAQEEIASLQHVLNETVKEGSYCRMELDTEVRKLKEMISKLQEDNATLKIQLPREGNDSPQLSLSNVTKSLARKVASQLGADNLSSGPDNLEESMRKAQEDAEELRSLVVPLEEEIKALKEKFRSTDEELQKFKEERVLRRLNDPSSSSEAVCDMCMNYETQLVNVQKTVKDLEKKLVDSVHALQVQKEDLTKEVKFRKEMEEKWNEKKEEYKVKLVELDGLSQRSHQMLVDLKQTYKQTENGIREQLHRLVTERDEVKKHLHELQRRNEMLIGKYNRKSQELQNENINMPNTVEELHLSILNIREELIIAKIAQEDAQEVSESLQLKSNMLTEQMEQVDGVNEQLNRDLIQMRSQLELHEHERKQFAEREEKMLELQKKLEEMAEEKKKADMVIAEFRQRVSILQRELDNSEGVSKDFVGLSQQLQIQLEKIRESGSEVRWQHEEDVNECQNCRAAFNVGKKTVKQHCRHCGHIFCQSCLSNVVNSGPNHRPNRVCDVCHTLLVPETAPYFSQGPPHMCD